MTHHNRRARAPKPVPDTPETRQLVADMIETGERLAQGMARPDYGIAPIYLTKAAAEEYRRLMDPKAAE